MLLHALAKTSIVLIDSALNLAKNWTEKMEHVVFPRFEQLSRLAIEDAEGYKNDIWKIKVENILSINHPLRLMSIVFLKDTLSGRYENFCLL